MQKHFCHNDNALLLDKINPIIIGIVVILADCAPVRDKIDGQKLVKEQRDSDYLRACLFGAVFSRS